MSPTNAPAYCLERVSKPRGREREPKQSLTDSLSSGDKPKSLGRSRQVKYIGQNPEEIALHRGLRDLRSARSTMSFQKRTGLSAHVCKVTAVGGKEL